MLFFYGLFWVTIFCFADVSSAEKKIGAGKAGSSDVLAAWNGNGHGNGSFLEAGLDVEISKDNSGEFVCASENPMAGSYR